jgi:hypothetical protein
MRRRLHRPERGLEAIVTIGLAVVLALLGLVDVVRPATVAAATLAILSALTFVLVDQHSTLARMDDRLARMSEAAGSGTMSRPITSESGAKVRLEGVTDIRLVGVTLGRTMRNLADDLSRRAAAGARIRVVVIDPSTGAPDEAARRCTVTAGRTVFDHRLRPTFDLLRAVAAGSGHGGRVEIRAVPFVPAYGLILLDPELDSGLLLLDVYSHRPAGPEPTLTLTPATEPYWFRHFCREFDHLWAHARPIDPTAPIRRSDADTAARRSPRTRDGQALS